MTAKPTHYINGSLSCVGLIFSSSINLTRNCKIEQLPDEICHHKIIYETLDFYIPHSPPYFREIWDFKNANIESIQKSISNFD